MTLVFFILGLTLFIVATTLNKKKAAFAKIFNRQSFAIEHLVTRWIIAFTLLAVINMLLFVIVLCGITLSKWIAVIDVVVVLLTSMVLSFQLMRQMS